MPEPLPETLDHIRNAAYKRGLRAAKLQDAHKLLKEANHLWEAFNVWRDRTRSREPSAGRDALTVRPEAGAGCSVRRSNVASSSRSVIPKSESAVMLREAAAALRSRVALSWDEVDALNCALDHMTATKWTTPCMIPAHVKTIRDMLALYAPKETE